MITSEYEDKSSVDLEAFREKLKEYRQLAGYSQKAIAAKLGLHGVVLSNKLNSTPRYYLTHLEVKKIILTLAEWEAITTQPEARELLELAGLPANAFTDEDWKTTPLNQLEWEEVLHAKEAKEKKEAAPVSVASPTEAKPLHNLPAQLTPLIGRLSELTQLQTLVQQPQTRLLTLCGVGGVGKTRLATQLGANLAKDFSDGVWFVALAAISEPDLVVSAISQNLGLAGQPTLANLTKHLQARQLLLILDNFEQLSAATGIIQNLLKATTHLKIIVTSRAVLHLPGEQRFEVPPLPVPLLDTPAQTAEIPLNFSELSQNEAVQLFNQRARALNSSFGLTVDNASLIGQICARLEGLPLAIELAAARTRLLPLAAILERLSNRLSLLAGSMRGVLAHHQTLQATLDWSFRLLEPAEKELFVQLAFFPTSFSLATACTICELSQSENEQAQASDTAQFNELVARLITSLSDKSLLKAVLTEAADDSPGSTPVGQTRFGMLETLREYGLLQLEQHTPQAALEQRYLKYYTELTEKANKELAGQNQAYWVSELGLELPNLRLALKLAVKLGEIEAGLRIAEGLSRFWWMRGHLVEGRQWLETFLTAATANSIAIQPDLKVKILVGLGRILRQLGDYGEATKVYKEALELAKSGSDTEAIANTLYHLGSVYFYQSKYKEATALLEESLPLQRTLPEKHSLSASLNALGAINIQLGNLPQAQLYFEESLRYLQELGDIQSASFIFNNMGALAHEMGNHEEAVSYYQQGLTLQKKLGNITGIANSLSNLGVIAQDQGDYEEAAEWHEQSLKLWTKYGQQRGIALCLCNLGQVALYKHDYPEALVKLKGSLQLFRQQQELVAIAVLLEVFGGLAVETNQLERAGQLLGAAQNLRDTIKAPLSPGKRKQYDYYLEKLQTQLAQTGNPAALEIFWQAGSAMTLEAAIDYALTASENPENP